LLLVSVAILLFASSTQVASAADTPVVVATVPVGSGPLGVAVSPDGAFAYVSNFTSNTLSVLDMDSRTVVSTITGVSSPQGLAFTPDGSHAYVTVTNGFARIATATHSVVQTISGGNCTTPVQIVANPAGGAMYAACGDNDRGVSIDTTSQGVNDGLVNNPPEAINDVAIAPDGGSLIWARDNFVWFPGTGGRTYTTSAPTAIAVVQGITQVLSVNSASGTLNVISTTSETVTDTITVGGTPQDIALSSDATRGYVTDSSSDELVVVDLVAKSILHRVAVGSTPQQVALTPDDRYTVVTNFYSNTVTIVDLTPAREVSGGDVPRAPLQEFARAEADSCDTQPDDLVDFPALGHLDHLNWGPSWAWWPNGGTGGFVCTRQPYYTNLDSWSVR